MKFGGTSVGDPEKIKDVARRLVAAREAGNRVVGVLSAMGDTTDELLDLAPQVSPRPHPRELDMLISVGERISSALCAMAIHDLGHEAISLTGSQAGIVTDTSHGKAKIVEVRARRIHEALDEDQIVLVAGFQGVSTDHDVTTLGRGGSDTTAVALAAALGASTARSTPTSRRLHRRPAPRPGRAQARRGLLRGDARDGRVRRGRDGARSVEVARSHGVRLHVRSTFGDDDGHLDPGGGRDDAREGAHLRGRAPARGDGLPRRAETSPARLFAALADAGVNVDMIVQNGDEIVFSAPVERPRATPSARSTGSTSSGARATTSGR